MAQPPERCAGPPAVALVTGAGRGIGRGIALALAETGARIAVHYQASAEAAQAVANEISRRGGEAICVRADVADLASHPQLVESVLARWGCLDWLVNNAGIAPPQRADLLEADPASYDRVMAVNLRGPYFLTQRVARHLVTAAAADPPGRERRRGIVNIGSISAYTASVNRGEYCVSKAGVAMMTRLFAARLAAHGVAVFEVRPGIIATDMTAGVQEKYDRLIHDQGLLPVARWGTPDDVGQAVRAIVEGRFPYSTGTVLDVDGGFHLRRL